jgi:hypothetical protein
MQIIHLIQQSIGFFAPMKKQLAYLDPGTGSYIISIIIATFLGGLFLLRTQLKQFINSITRLFSKNKADADHPVDTDHPADTEHPTADQPQDAQPQDAQPQDAQPQDAHHNDEQP